MPVVSRPNLNTALRHSISHISTDRRLVRYRPAEVDFCLDNLFVSHGQYFCVAEAGTTCLPAFISDEHPICVLYEIDDLKVRDRPAIGPAAIEIGEPGRCGCPEDW